MAGALPLAKRSAQSEWRVQWLWTWMYHAFTLLRKLDDDAGRLRSEMRARRMMRPGLSVSCRVLSYCIVPCRGRVPLSLSSLADPLLRGFALRLLCVYPIHPRWSNSTLTHGKRRTTWRRASRYAPAKRPVLPCLWCGERWWEK